MMVMSDLDVTEILKQIKNTESKAENIISESEYNKISANAMKQADEIFIKVRQEIKNETEILYKNAKEESELEAEKIREISSKEIDKIKKNANDKIEKAIKKVMEIVLWQ